MALRQPHDLVVVGFYGHPLILLTKRFTTKPILFDPFVSTFDTMSLDRQAFAPGSLFGRFCFHLDRQSLQQSTFLLSDTKTHADFYATTFQVARHKFHNLYLGCDETIFYPRQASSRADHFTVFNYSTYLPLHGMDTIVHAAAHCAALPIRFRLVGDQGPTFQRVQRTVVQLGLTNIDFVPSLPFDQLPNEIARASVCLGGPFGVSEKATRVIAGKTYQFIATAKAVILGDTPGNRELFQDQVTGLFCKPGDAQSLAAAVKMLYEDAALRHAVGQQAYTLFRSQLTWATLEKQLVQMIEHVLATP